MKIFLTGGAGLVGINLIASIKSSNPDWEIVVVDKNLNSIKVARRIFPDVNYLCEDLSLTKNQKWPFEIKDCDVCIMLQAEIGGTNDKLFEINNIKTTKVILNALQKFGLTRIIHISSSVVNSKSNVDSEWSVFITLLFSLSGDLITSSEEQAIINIKAIKV